MFDELFIVIDLYLKWKLWLKLKELYQWVKVIMIYVIYDQIEVLIFVDQVVVMQEGEIVQIGMLVELFEWFVYMFVGYFIGFLGMNVLLCDVKDGVIFFGGEWLIFEGIIQNVVDGGVEVGIWLEFVLIFNNGVGVLVIVWKVFDIGWYKVVEVIVYDICIYVILEEDVFNVGGIVKFDFKLFQICFYKDGWLVSILVEGVVQMKM